MTIDWPNDFETWAEDDMGWDHETDAPGIMLFANALQIWTIFQPECTASVADAVKTFRISSHRIIEAVNEHTWMFLSGPDDDLTKLMINHQGE